MTPLAYRIVKDLTRPARKRLCVDRCGLLERMRDIHCFEVSEIVGAMQHLLTVKEPTGPVRDAAFWSRLSDISARTSFLPAKRTWIEWADTKARIGFLLQEEDGHALCSCAWEPIGSGYAATPDYSWAFPLASSGEKVNSYVSTRDLSAQEEIDVSDHTSALHGFLAFINSPRIIGREEHSPHRGLERKLIATLGRDGMFPLHPWSEIKLDVTPPSASDGTDEDGGRITGAKALHFCRSHLRIRNGQIEMVKAHWRGDPALGVVQSRYKVVGG